MKILSSLDFLETDASTAAEIKTSYESNENTNAYTDAEKGKVANVPDDTNASLSGKADLIDGKIPASQLPGFVDDVLEYADVASFPETGEAGKIYIALDTNKTYRWATSTYIIISDVLSGAEVKSLYEGNANTNAFTDAEKSKLAGVEAGAKANVKSDWDASSGDAEILNKPVVLSKKIFQITGNDSYIAFTLTHNLATKDVVVQIRENASPFGVVGVDVEMTDTNNVTVKFAVAPANAVKYDVVIIG